MSQENVEIARAFFEAWNAADMDAFRELYDPDVIVRTVKDWPEPGPYVGRGAAMRFHEQLRDTWDTNTGVPISDFIDAGDRVAVRYVWRGAGHGPDLNMELTLVFTMRKGRIFYQEFFWDHAEALEAVGLSEQPLSQENVEIVRAMWEPFKGLDTTAIDWDAAIREIGQTISPEVELRWSATGPEARVYRGRDGVAQAFREWVEPFREYHSEPLDYIGVGDSVVVPIRHWGIGRASGAPVEIENTQVYQFRGNQIARVDEYDTLEEALEAARLRE